MQSCIDDPIPDLRWENLLRWQVFSVFLWQQDAQHPGLLHVQKLTAVCLQISQTWAVNLMYWTASAGKLYLPWAACLPRPCSTGTGESFSSCNTCLSRITEIPSPRCPSTFIWWLCHRQRDSKIVSFLYEIVLEMVQSLKGIILPEGQESRETSARQEKPCLNCRWIFLFFVVKWSEFGTGQFKNECDATLSYAVKLRHKPDPVFQQHPILWHCLYSVKDMLKKRCTFLPWWI